MLSSFHINKERNKEILSKSTKIKENAIHIHLIARMIRNKFEFLSLTLLKQN